MVEADKAAEHDSPIPWSRVALAVGAVLWAALPFLLATGDPSALISIDALAILLLLVVRPSMRVLGLLAYGALLAWEVVRAAGASLMDQDPLLYDLIYLVRHVVVLGQDLLGGAFVPAVLGAVVALVVALVLGVALMDFGRSGPRRNWVLGALAVALPLWAIGGPARFSAVALANNVVQSVQVRNDVAALVRGSKYDVYDDLQLTDAPDLHVYVVESYGRLLLKRQATRARWVEGVGQRAPILRDAGYHVVSAYGTAPVSGGRSWLADATLLTGRRIAHESVFQQVMAKVEQMQHLPRILADTGYHTILVRPKDRARPGVELRNDHDFASTVFFEELAYEGPPIGWGWIPDQYTLGWLRQEYLGAEDGPPRFVFAHLVSSHAPWRDLPEQAMDWRSLGTPTGRDEPLHEADTRDPWTELGVQLGRYQRREGHRGQRKARSDHLQRYADAVDYDLDVLTEHLLGLPDRPAIVVLLGDHQPPLVSRSDDFDVPIHVLARDPALLEPLRQHGFVDGWVLSKSAEPVLTLEGWMSLTLHQLGAQAGVDLPVWAK